MLSSIHGLPSLSLITIVEPQAQKYKFFLEKKEYFMKKSKMWWRNRQEIAKNIIWKKSATHEYIIETQLLNKLVFIFLFKINGVYLHAFMRKPNLWKSLINQ